MCSSTPQNQFLQHSSYSAKDMISNQPGIVSIMIDFIHLLKIFCFYCLQECIAVYM